MSRSLRRSEKTVCIASLGGMLLPGLRDDDGAAVELAFFHQLVSVQRVV